ncbi:type I-G CRISPR-associated protein, Cas3-extension family [Coraliomargarita sp. W4R53]
MSDKTHSIILTGLDGSNPLGYLAALGTFRIISHALETKPQLTWTTQGGAWKPEIILKKALTDNQLIELLNDQLGKMIDHPVFTFAKNPAVPAIKFTKLAADLILQGQIENDLRGLEFLAAFGSDGITDEKGLIQDTALRTMSGAGHQHFLKFMNDIAKNTNVSQLKEALFGPWAYSDTGPSLRFDPGDDRRYALRWKNPSSDASTSVRGANRLAIEGLPMFPTTPKGSLLETTGFTGHKSNNTYWTWPIWDAEINLDMIKSLLSLEEMTKSKPNATVLKARGITAIFRSQRITVGKFRNFTPSIQVA